MEAYRNRPPTPTPRVRTQRQETLKDRGVDRRRAVYGRESTRPRMTLAEYQEQLDRKYERKKKEMQEEVFRSGWARTDGFAWRKNST